MAPAAGVANVVLIGYRGSGKTSVGRAIATRLGWDFIDTDEMIEAEAGRSVREIFEADGETGFRKLEAAAIERVASGRHQVISVGGGAVLAAENRRHLRAAGRCVWLTAPAAVLHARMGADPLNASLRPALTSEGGLEEVIHVLAAREPLYHELADCIIDTESRTIDELAELVLNELGIPRSGGATQ
ncbi:MAG: shikimate kinase [Phycisphaerae bacterium]|nr:shikimate kinase [Phycisphaerae bacterium]